jgi:ankyrin repeat protein
VTAPKRAPRIVTVVMVAMLLWSCDRFHADTRDEHGMTALMRAAKAGNVAEAERLIARGANVNAKVPTRDFQEFIAFISWMRQLPASDIGYTPLMYAAQGGHADVAQLLLRKGANVNDTNRGGETALGIAVFRSNVPVMTLLVTAGARVESRHLAVAVPGGTEETVTFLLQHGANPNAAYVPSPSYKGPTPALLIVAVRRGDPAIVRLLLEAGANRDVRDATGWNALRWAKNGKSQEVVDLLERVGLRDGGEADDALLAAVWKKDVEAVRTRLEARADPNTRDSRGVTPLVIAARNGDVDAVDLLLRAGADPSGATPHDATPLIGAARQGHVPVIERLLAAGADVRHRDRIMETALYTAANWRREAAVRTLLAANADPNDGSLRVAALRGNISIARLLLDGGADPARDPLVLYEAARGGSDEVVMLLLERGARARPDKDQESTPLHRAASFCGPEVLRALIARGADPNAREGGGGSTPLVYAALNGRLDNVRVLLAAGADPNARASDGKTILQHASGHPEVEQELRRAGAR